MAIKGQCEIRIILPLLFNLVLEYIVSEDLNLDIVCDSKKLVVGLEARE